MIDYRKLNETYNNDGIYALQLEVGDICYQACIYCYMNALSEHKNQLSDEKISEIINDSYKLGITAIEWLGGEPLLRKSIFKHMAKAMEFGIRNNMWTGGLPLADKEILKKNVKYTKHGLISVHVSTVQANIYKKLHPSRPVKDLEIIINAVRDILETGYPSNQILNSVTYTGLQSADDMIETIDYFEKEFGIKTSLNVYHTYLRPDSEINLSEFIPDKKEVAKVYKRYNKQYGSMQLPMNCVNKQYCSATMAVLYEGSVTPCATIREIDAPNVNNENLITIFKTHKDYLIFKKIKDNNNLPENCRKCQLNSECWGCRSRSFAAGNGVYGKDPRCYRH